MDQTRSRNNPPTRFRRIVSTLCMPAHCYFIPAVHAERRPAIQIHPHKSGQAEPQIPRINTTKLNITKQAKKKNALGSGLGGETEGGNKMERDDLFYLHFTSQWNCVIIDTAIIISIIIIIIAIIFITISSIIINSCLVYSLNRLDTQRLWN